MWTALAAADFSGTGRADLLLFSSIAVPGGDGTTSTAAPTRIAYDLDADGEPAYWGPHCDATVSVGERPTSLVLGPLDAGSEAVRHATAQAFRQAAAAAQERLAEAVPAASSSPPPPVDLVGLASVVRTAVDPAITVPSSVADRLELPGELGASVEDALQPLAFTPRFPQPFYETVRDGFLARMVPGFSGFPDEAITVLGADALAVEALLVAPTTS